MTSTWWTDCLGYEGRTMRCTDPPAGVRITAQPTRRMGGTEEIPVCAECLKRWRKTQALKAREAVK